LAAYSLFSDYFALAIFSLSLISPSYSRCDLLNQALMNFFELFFRNASSDYFYAAGSRSLSDGYEIPKVGQIMLDVRGISAIRNNKIKNINCVGII